MTADRSVNGITRVLRRFAGIRRVVPVARRTLSALKPAPCVCGEPWNEDVHFHSPILCTDDALLAAGVWDREDFDWSYVVDPEAYDKPEERQ